MSDTRLLVNYPPDPNPRPPKFKPPPGTCDSHFHIYGPPHPFPYVENRRSTPPAAPIEHYLAMAAVLGMERGVLVASNVHGFETEMVLDGIARGEGRLRGVINADPDLTAAQIKALHAGGISGMRFNFTGAHGRAFVEDDFFRALAKFDHLPWSADLHIDLDVVVTQADAFARASVPVVIDHFARADGSKGIDDPDFRVLLDLLAGGNVWMKISGADRLMMRGARFADIKAMARALIARAPDRIIWGTDWPHSERYKPGEMPNDGDLLDMMTDYAPDEAPRKKILVENPKALFGFE